MKFLIGFISLFLSVTSFAEDFQCDGTNVDQAIAKEMISFLECGGQVNGGKGECVRADKYELMVTNPLPPQAAYRAFQLRDSDELQLVSIEIDKRESKPERKLDVRVVSFDLIRDERKLRFTFNVRMIPPHQQYMYGCASIQGGIEKCQSVDLKRCVKDRSDANQDYYFVGKPALTKDIP